MKNKFIILIIAILFLFAETQAQTFTQIFDSVFTHVSRTDATTGMGEQVLPFGENPLCQFSTTSPQIGKNDTSYTINNKHSVGISAFCSFVGVSLKFNLKNNLYLQTDFGGNAYLNFLFIPVSPGLGADFGAQVYLLYEDVFPHRTNVFWVAGCGLNLAGVPHIPYSKQVSLKGGAKAILGIECALGNTPFSIQVDTRWGYGIMYSTKGVRSWERNGYIPEDNPYHFLDYSIVFSLRYHFDKRIDRKKNRGADVRGTIVS